jgi:hypothetical protein
MVVLEVEGHDTRDKDSLDKKAFTVMLVPLG